MMTMTKSRQPPLRIKTWLVQEYCDCGQLFAWCERVAADAGSLQGILQRLALLADAAAGLCELHGKSVVHGDLVRCGVVVGLLFFVVCHLVVCDYDVLPPFFPVFDCLPQSLIVVIIVVIISTTTNQPTIKTPIEISLLVTSRTRATCWLQAHLEPRMVWWPSWQIWASAA